MIAIPNACWACFTVDARSARRDLGIAGTRSAINKYKVLGACAYPIPIQNLRELRDRLAVEFGAKLPVLSMGMSGDFVAAIAAGSTLVRVGSALFGTRAAAAQ